jgi:hypothetical protein
MSYIGQKPADKLVTSSDMEDGIVTTAKIADSSVTTEKIVADTNFRNIIINGDMSLAQRATSASSLTENGYNTCDRWYSQISSTGTWSQSQSTDVPTGQGFATSYKWDCTTADASLAAGDSILFQQRVEAQNLQYLKKGTANAESTTLSFWVKSNKTGIYIANLYDENNRDISQSYTISSADTWEKKTLTFAGDTSGAFGNDNAIGLYVNFYLAAGSNYSSGTLGTTWSSYTAANVAVGQVNLADSTDNEWYITGVQLEAGTTASDFEFLPVDVNLGRCQRYYETFSQGCNGTAYSTTGISFAITYKTTKRAAPSGTLLDTSINVNRAAVGDYTSSGSSIVGASYKTSGALLNIDGWSGLTSTIAMYPPYTQDDWIAFSSEL